MAIVSMLRKILMAQSCSDCKIVPTVTKHGDKFNDLQLCDGHKKEVAALKASTACEECGGTIVVDGYDCQSCCEHDFDPDEGFMCLRCAKEGAEDVMADAYDAAKNLRKCGG